MSSRKTPEDIAATMPLHLVAATYNDLGAGLRNPNPLHPLWITYTAVRHEFHYRLAQHYATLPSTEIVAILRMAIQEPWADKACTAQAVVDVIERELRERFPGAAVESDAFIDTIDLSDPTVGDYGHLQVLIDHTGVSS